MFKGTYARSQVPHSARSSAGLGACIHPHLGLTCCHAFHEPKLNQITTAVDAANRARTRVKVVHIDKEKDFLGFSCMRSHQFFLHPTLQDNALTAGSGFDCWLSGSTNDHMP